MVPRVHVPGQHQLFGGRKLIRLGGLVLGLREGGDDQAGEHGDDADDGQQLDQGEPHVVRAAEHGNGARHTKHRQKAGRRSGRYFCSVAQKWWSIAQSPTGLGRFPIPSGNGCSRTGPVARCIHVGTLGDLWVAGKAAQVPGSWLCRAGCSGVGCTHGLADTGIVGHRVRHRRTFRLAAVRSPRAPV